MENRLFKTIGFILILVLTTVSLGFTEELATKKSIQISLIYPQKSNAPKRKARKIDKPEVLKAEVFVDVRGISPAQLKNPLFYLEYFLDNDLLYPTENKKLDKTKTNSLGFILDTRAYPNGEHTLVVNLWDKDGPSAIGIKKINIQNKSENEN